MFRLVREPSTLSSPRRQFVLLGLRRVELRVEGVGSLRRLVELRAEGVALLAEAFGVGGDLRGEGGDLGNEALSEIA